MVSLSRFTCCSVRLRQMRPRACFAMKLMASGVTNCAASTRSPSFSRSASSTRMTMRPLRSSSSALTTRVMFSSFSKWAILSIDRLSISGIVRGGRRACRGYLPRRSPSPHGLCAPGRGPQRLGDDEKLDLIEALQRVHRQRDAVKRDRALLDHVLRETLRQLQGDPLAVANRLACDDLADA